MEWPGKLKNETNHNSLEGALTLSGTGADKRSCDSTYLATAQVNFCALSFF